MFVNLMTERFLPGFSQTKMTLPQHQQPHLVIPIASPLKQQTRFSSLAVNYGVPLLSSNSERMTNLALNYYLQQQQQEAQRQSQATATTTLVPSGNFLGLMLPAFRPYLAQMINHLPEPAWAPNSLGGNTWTFPMNEDARLGGPSHGAMSIAQEREASVLGGFSRVIMNPKLSDSESDTVICSRSSSLRRDSDIGKRFLDHNSVGNTNKQLRIEKVNRVLDDFIGADDGNKQQRKKIDNVALNTASKIATTRVQPPTLCSHRSSISNAGLRGERRLIINFLRYGTCGAVPQTYGKSHHFVPDGLVGQHVIYHEEWKFSITHGIPVQFSNQIVVCITWKVVHIKSGVEHSRTETLQEALERAVSGRTITNEIFRNVLEARAKQLMESAEREDNPCRRASIESLVKVLRPRCFNQGLLVFGLQHKVVQDMITNSTETRVDC